MKGAFHIADWAIEPQINSVKRAHQSFHVEPKVMQVLVELASHSNEVLTKEQLIQAVWSDTFVSDDVLTRCISEIRRVLQDDARAPKFIQTIPKTGYRLIAKVEFDRSEAPRLEAVVPERVPVRVTRTGVERRAPERRGRPTWWLPTLLAVAIIAAGVLAFRLWRRPSAVIPPVSSFTIVPFTSYPGAQTQPAFSPDGNQVAFAWNGGQGGDQDIYIKMIGNETPLRLTSDPADELSPTWSPDGRSIAFLRFADEELGIYVIPSLGGTARKVFKPVGKVEWERGALSWSPDGKRLIFPDGKSAKDPSAIYSLDLGTGIAEQITSPPKFWDGDSSPTFSPDGEKIAFVRGSEGWVRDVYVMGAKGGEPKRLTFDDRMVSNVAWTADSSAIVFSSNRAGKFSLWRVAAAGGNPERLPMGSEDAFSPAIAARGNHLAYTQTSSAWNIKRINLRSAKAATTILWSSSQEDSAPQFSPDGRRIAFQSWRSGSQEVWVSSSDGSNPVKVTSFEKSLTGSPSWSPDGSQLAFDSRPEGRSHIYAIRVDGGPPRSLTDGNFNDILPNWSRDGRWVYFGSNRSGSWQIWKVPSSGGTPDQVTRQGGFVGMESYDGQWLYFAKGDAAGIWRIPVGGGDEQQIVDQPKVGFWGYWTMARNGIYFLDQSSSPVTIDYAGLSGERRVKLRTLDHNPSIFAGLTVTPDEHTLLYSDQVEADSHITLVDGFR